MATSQPVKKIAILGGGIGSLTTAFALTSRRNWRERYEITVYQMGWRLGGKGASGRNGEPGYGDRIEEHGFHVWMGFYDNAFKMMKEAYAELARTAGPFREWTDAFKKHSHVVIEELDQNQRKRWEVLFPTTFREPGTFVRLGLIGYAARMFKLLSTRLPSTRLPDAPPHKRVIVAPLQRMWQKIWRTAFIALLLVLALAEYFLRLAENRFKRYLATTRAPSARAALSPLSRLLARIVRTFRALVEGSSQIVIAWATTADVSDPDDGRRLKIFFDLSLAILRGIIVDDIIANGFDSIDHLEFKDWLRRHNARSESVDSAIVNAIYDGNFSFSGGDRSKPNFAAGVALHCFLRIFLDYKGALLYRMQAGMGDVVITPLFEVLEKRGVRFRFFHRVDELVYDAETKRITAIEVTEQVAVKAGEYRPLVTVPVDDGKIMGWPSQPRYDLIEDGEELKASGINLESQWAQPWKGSRRKQLLLGTRLRSDRPRHLDWRAWPHLPTTGRAPSSVAGHDREGGYRGDTGDAALDVADDWRAGVAVVLDAGRELREPWSELAGFVAGDSVRTLAARADRFGCVFLLRVAGRAEHPAAWPEHLSGGSAPRRPAGASTLARAARRVLVASVDDYRKSARGRLGPAPRSAESHRRGPAGLAVFPRERGTVRPVRAFVGGRDIFPIAPGSIGCRQSLSCRRLDAQHSQRRVRRGHRDVRAALFTGDCRVSPTHVRRAPVRHVWCLSPPLPA